MTDLIDPRALRAIGEFGAQQKATELSALLSFLDSRRTRTVLEIGSWTGGTLWVWTQIAEQVVSVDVNPSPTDHIDNRRLFMVVGDSHLDSTKDRLPPTSFDVLHIDGDHTDAGVRRDYEMYAPLVAPDGVVVIHDIVPHLAISGIHVDPFWEELKDSHEVVEFIDTNPCPFSGQGEHDAGIGVILP